MKQLRELKHQGEVATAEGSEGDAKTASPGEDKGEKEDSKGDDKKSAADKNNLIEKLKKFIICFIVGLGNPTPNSENNRHNVGFKIIDAINQNLDFQNKPKFKGLLTTGTIGGKKLCY